MKVLVTFAVPTEFAPWRMRRGFREGQDSVHRARMGAADLRVVLTGVGPEHAARAVRGVMNERPDVCISSGFAGALRPEHPVGRVLVAGAVRFRGSEMELRADEQLVELAVRCGAHPAARFCTSGTLAQTAVEKTELGCVADAVEMESYAVLAEAARHHIPAVAIRIVSDAAGTDLPYDFTRARDAAGQIRLAGVLAQIARRPQRVPALLRLSRDCMHAAEDIAAFLDRYVGAWQMALTESEAAYEVAAT